MVVTDDDLREFHRRPYTIHIPSNYADGGLSQSYVYLSKTMSLTKCFPVLPTIISQTLKL